MGWTKQEENVGISTSAVRRMERWYASTVRRQGQFRGNINSLAGMDEERNFNYSSLGTLYSFSDRRRGMERGRRIIFSDTGGTESGAGIVHKDAYQKRNI